MSRLVSSAQPTKLPVNHGHLRLANPGAIYGLWALDVALRWLERLATCGLNRETSEFDNLEEHRLE